MGASLSRMTEELKKSCLIEEDKKREFGPLYKWVDRKFPNENLSKKEAYFQALTQKQFFPYGLLSNLERLRDKKLPPQSEWYDPLKSQCTPQSDVEYATQVFELFECVDIMAYLRIYLEADVRK